MALIVTSIVLSCTLVGALAVVGYRWHKTRQKAQADVAFEAALQDSGLGLDDAFEQVGPPQDSLLIIVDHALCLMHRPHPLMLDFRCQTVTQY